ncbi:hypothetical protein NDU88_001894 [Pleurodeles waltl]|uniref:Uncharacterized protein n=1 Tax=Pleurodeles waltl TaxID=8319 RepID=A0AAV7KQS2_PLEWA|nr:hypothetical protein NDU88_001894 [Pleurodeles waltl]
MKAHSPLSPACVSVDRARYGWPGSNTAGWDAAQRLEEGMHTSRPHVQCARRASGGKRGGDMDDDEEDLKGTVDAYPCHAAREATPEEEDPEMQHFSGWSGVMGSTPDGEASGAVDVVVSQEEGEYSHSLNTGSQDPISNDLLVEGPHSRIASRTLSERVEACR